MITGYLFEHRLNNSAYYIAERIKRNMHSFNSTIGVQYHEPLRGNVKFVVFNYPTLLDLTCKRILNRILKDSI